MTRPNGDAEESWRRPGDTADTPPGQPAPKPPPAPNPPPPPGPAAAPSSPPAPGPPRGARRQGPGYAGPPATVPPPPGWRPPVEYEPAPPRELPAQDHADLDTAEQNARTVTVGVGLVVGAIVLIVICVLCSRVLF